MKQILWILLCVFAFGAGKAQGNNSEPDEFCEKLHIYGENRPLTPHEHRQKYGSAGWTFIKDEGIWAYSTWFRKMFGMPCDRVDNDLKGAENVVVYFSRTTRKRCHEKVNGEKNCVRSWLLHLDLYLPPKQDIGCTGDYLENSKPVYNSLFELAKKKPELREKWEELFDLDDVRMYLVAPDGTKRQIYIEPVSYDKESRGDLVRVETLIDEEALEGSADHVRLVEFRNKDGKVVHTVELTRQFGQQMTTYSARFPELTPENWRGGTEEGDFVWVYTKEFAEEYGLPDNNISEELEGASAIAFRMAHYGTVRCGFFGGGDSPESCSEETKKLFEFYLPAEAKLEYRNNRQFWKNYSAGKSHVFIHFADKLDEKSEHYLNSRKSGLKKLFHIRRNREKSLFSHIDTYKIDGYQTLYSRDYYQPGTVASGFGYFQAFGFSMLDGDENYLVFTDTLKVTRYSKDDLFNKEFHRVKIPRSFRNNVQKNIDKFYNKNGSLWQKVSDHFGFKK